MFVTGAFVLWGALAGSTGPVRQPVLSQIALPHSYYYRASLEPRKDRLSADIQGTLTVDESGWLLLRAWNDGPHPDVLDIYPWATTSPVYVQVGNDTRRSREAASYFLRWIDRIRDATEKNAQYRSTSERDAVLRDLERARGFYAQIVDGSGGADETGLDSAACARSGGTHGIARRRAAERRTVPAAYPRAERRRSDARRRASFAPTSCGPAAGTVPHARLPNAIRQARMRSRSTRPSRARSNAATRSSCRTCAAGTRPTASSGPTKTRAATDTTRSSGRRGSRGRTAGSARSGCRIRARCSGSPRSRTRRTSRRWCRR